MIRYYVWDKKLSDQIRLERMLEDILECHHWPYKSLEIYEKQHKLFRDMHDKTSYQVFFIGLTEEENGKISGLEVAKKVRKACPYASIILCADSIKLIPTVVHQKIEALDYIDKNISDSDFYQILDSCVNYIMNQLNRPKHELYFHLQTEGQYLELLVTDIMFFETAPTHHKICLHMKNTQIEFYGKLSEVSECHPYFVRCHKSYVANVMTIEYVDRRKRKLHFLNGEVCHISRPYLDQVVERFLAFHRTVD